MSVTAYLEDDHTLVDRLARETSSEARMELIRESIEAGEAALGASDDAAEVANVMLAVASSHLLAVNEATSPKIAEAHARAAAGWAARVVRLAEGPPGPVLHFVPRAGTVVAAAMAYVPDEARRTWMALIEPWPQMVADAIAAQPGLARDGTSDLIVGLSLLEGSDAASPEDEPAVRREAMGTLRRAEHSLSMAGETELAAEARRALDTAQP